MATDAELKYATQYRKHMEQVDRVSREMETLVKRFIQVEKMLGILKTECAAEHEAVFDEGLDKEYSDKLIAARDTMEKVATAIGLDYAAAESAARLSPGMPM